MLDRCINLYTASITSFELRRGETNLEIIEEFLSKVKILSFDDLSAIIASNLFKNLKKKGLPVDLRNLFIAATCIRNGCKLLSKNKKHFQQIKELEIA